MFSILATESASSAGWISMVVWLVILFAFMYFFMVRPQKKEQQQLRQEYIFAVKNNLRSTLNNIDIKEKDGSITRLQDLDPTRKA